MHPVYRPDQSGFPRPGQPYDRDKLSLRNLQIDMLQCLIAVWVFLPDILELDHIFLPLNALPPPQRLFPNKPYDSVFVRFAPFAAVLPPAIFAV